MVKAPRIWYIVYYTFGCQKTFRNFRKAKAFANANCSINEMRVYVFIETKYAMNEITSYRKDSGKWIEEVL